MKKLVLFSLLTVMLYTGCDLIDGTNVENPNLTLDKAVGQPNSATAWLNGMKIRMVRIQNAYLVVAELTSDNYVNKATFYNQNVDAGVFRYQDVDYNTIQFNLHALREQANYGLTTVLDLNPDDKGTSIEADFNFYKGWSHLLSGELFVALPAEAGGVPQDPTTHFQAAIAAFNAAEAITPSTRNKAALARAYYNLGDKTNAVSFANAVIAADANFLYNVEFDRVNDVVSTIESAVWIRASFDDLQPLPRLDYLDPKYGDNPSTTSSPVAILKVEEAHLILAEALLHDNNLAGAKARMETIRAYVATRPTRVFNETTEGRIGANSTVQRPNKDSVEVRSDATSPYKTGLVLNRTSTTTVPTVSATSVTAAEITAVANATDALAMLYLMRQEIFFGEGRRVVDLGIKYPISEVEYLNNSNVTTAHLEAFVPSYIPASYADMDAYTFVGNKFVTITVDMNKVLANQKGNQFN